MKFILGILCVVLIIAFVQSGFREHGGKFMEMAKNYEECAKENNAPEDLGEILKKNEFPTDKESICTIGCLNLKMGIMFPNMTLNITNVVSWVPHKYHITADKAQDLAETCNKAMADSTDKCDATEKLLNCFKENIN